MHDRWLSALSTSANALLITWDLTIGGGNIGTSTTTFEASGSTLTATGYSATTGTGLDADWSLNNLHLHDKGLAVRGGGNHGQVNGGGNSVRLRWADMVALADRL